MKNLFIFVSTAILFFYLGKTYQIEPKQTATQQTESCEYDVAKGTGFTGQDVWDGVQCYRKQKGLKPLILSEELCDGLSQRYYDSTSPEANNVAHYGFEKWAEKGPFTRGFKEVVENMAQQSNLKNVIEGWAGSPGHRIAMETEERLLACTYAFNGYAFFITGRK